MPLSKHQIVKALESFTNTENGGHVTLEEMFEDISHSGMTVSIEELADHLMKELSDE